MNLEDLMPSKQPRYKRTNARDTLLRNDGQSQNQETESKTNKQKKKQKVETQVPGLYLRDIF